MSEQYNTFGAQFRAWRKQMGLTQQDLSERLGVQHTYLSKIENDRVERPPSERLLREAAQILSVKEDAMLDACGRTELVTREDYNRIKNPSIEHMHYVKMLEAIEQVLENERDGYDNCRYCGAEDTPYQDGKPMVVVNGNVEDADEFVIDFHEDWCPSTILGNVRTAACLQLELFK